MFSTTNSTRDARPRFEYYPLDSPRLQTVFVEEFPFIIGRSASAALQINSTSVSREHAEIARTPTGFCVRDLNSTNGTTVNGRLVKESPLVDGDSVGIADTELTFVCTSMGRLQRTLTKPLPGKRAAATTPSISAEVSATRSMSEALLLQALPLRWNNLVCHATGEVLMTSAQIMSPLRDWMSNADAKDPTKVASRLELLGWHMAAEQLQEKSQSCGLLLNVTLRESLDDRLIDAVEEVAAASSTPLQVGIAVHWEWATATPETPRLLKRLREKGIQLVYDEFSGGGGCIESMEQAPPDYLILSPQVVRGTAEQPRRLQRLEIVLATCDARRIEMVTPWSTNSADQDACRQLGIRTTQLSDQADAEVAPPVAALA